MSVIGGKADEIIGKADMESPMSVFLLIMSVVGGKADIKSKAVNVRY